MDSNIFTSKLLDLIIPDEGVDGSEWDHIFLVMPLGTMDLKSFLQSSSAESMTEEHLITFLYNMLCSINYIHSMNIIHRDIKPANILIDEKCGVFVCDFGLSRANPELTPLEKEIEASRRKGQLKVQKSKGEERASRESQFK